MEPVSRRMFFKHAGAVAVVAGVAGAAASPLALGTAGASTLSHRDSEPNLAPNEELASHENLVAHVKNSRTGEISLFIGQREVTLHDRKIAARLVRATR
jgi:hypothetical protein